MPDEDLYGEELGEGDELGEGEVEGAADDLDQGVEELDELKRKLKEMEEEAARVKAVPSVTDAGPACTSGAAPGATNTAVVATVTADTEKAEIDSRSIYVGNVDYGCTPEELQQHFAQCGTVNRVTILTDKFGNPKGYSYVEFLEVDAVQNAVLLDSSELRGRQIKVVPKRTNVPGFKALRGRGRGRGPTGYGYPSSHYIVGRSHFTLPFRGRSGYFSGPPGNPPRGRGRGRFYAPY